MSSLARMLPIVGAGALALTALVLLTGKSGGKKPARKVSIETAAELHELLTPPAPFDEKGMRWSKLISSPQWKGPEVGREDLIAPIQRKATPLERYVLSQVVDPRVLEATTIYNGVRPVGIAPDFKAPEKMYAISFGRPTANGVEPVIWFPRPAMLFERWWLSILAHEMAHAQQGMMGSTAEQAIKSFERYGYEESPMEVQARWVQRRALDLMDRLASDAAA